MKEKEIKKIAMKIAMAEHILSHSENKTDRLKAKEDILSLSNSIQSLGDMMAIDEEVQNILSKNNLK